MTLVLGRFFFFFFICDRAQKIKSFSTYSPSPPLPPPSPRLLFRFAREFRMAKHHITGSVSPGANARSLADRFTLPLCLCIYLSFSQLESLTLSVRGAK